MRALPYLLGKKVTGIFAFNDMTAYGVYRQARNYNLRIPEDISVVGYDDLIFSDLIDPPPVSYTHLTSRARSMRPPLVRGSRPR